MRHVSLSLTLLLTAAAAQAAAPSVLSYTGTMADTSGAAVPNGTYALTASLFGAETGGTALWSETVNVRTDAGVFNALLGAEATSFDETALDVAELWLELAVEGDTLDPRLRVASVPYALQAGSASIADALNCDGCVTGQEIDDTQVQARITGTPCSPGTAVTAIGPDGMATCAAAMALAGSGAAPTASRSDHLHPLAGSGTAATAAHSDHDHMANYLPIGATVSCTDPLTERVVAIDALTGDVTCQPDLDTLYTAGAGISILGTTISVAFADAQCPPTEKLAGFSLGVPVCAPDIDTDTQSTLTQVPRANSLVVADTGNTGRYTSITIGTDGNPIISYYDGGSADDLRVLKCLTPDCSANLATTVDDGGVAMLEVGEYTSIAIGTDGLPVISYYDFTNTSLKVAHCTDASCVTPIMPTVIDGSGAPDIGARNALTIGTDGFPIIAYRDATATTLLAAHCTTADCSASSSNPVDGVNTGDQVSIAIGADGMPIIAYRDVGNSALKVAHCADVACASSSAVTVDGAIDSVGRYPSIAIGTDGLAVISYYDSTNTALKVIKCGDAACDDLPPNTLTTVDGSGLEDRGEHTSITIGVDGRPYVAYHDTSAGVLRLARCGDAACSAGNHLVTVDNGGGVSIVGTETSITIGADTLPVISYRDETNFALKVAKCANALCLPNWSRR